MLQITEKDRDVVGSVIGMSIHPNHTYAQINQVIKMLEQLKPIEVKKKKEKNDKEQ